jgi:hypothetical protein
MVSAMQANAPINNAILARARTMGGIDGGDHA